MTLVDSLLFYFVFYANWLFLRELVQFKFLVVICFDVNWLFNVMS